MSDRRDFLRKTALLGLSGLAGSLIGKEKLDAVESASDFLVNDGSGFMLPKLPYAYDALEPYIDKQTMEIHHTKHHQAYIDKLNGAPANSINFSVDDIAKCESVDAATTALIRNNLGGYFNHSLFWTLLKPNPKGEANNPSGALAEAINRDFKSFDDFKKEFSEKATKIFGSGWCWLILDTTNKLRIVTSPNQDNPYMKVMADRGKVVLALDVWEHAYYLKYQNKRADYISNWWNIVNWEKAAQFYSLK